MNKGGFIVKTSKLQKALTVFTVLVLLVSLITMGNTAVFASAAPVTNLRWDGNTARWDAPASGEVANYNLIVFKDEEFVVIFTPVETYVDLSKTLLGNGTGDYTFAVLVCYKNGEASEQTKSDVLQYIGTHVHKGVPHSFKYPTCTEMGSKEYYECKGCGKWFWDIQCKYEVESKMDIMLDAYGHDWGEWEVTKEPTATETGTKMRVCNNDPDHVETEEIPALGSTASSERSSEPVSEPESEPASSETVSEEVSDVPSEVESEPEVESSEPVPEDEPEISSEVTEEPATNADAESKDDTSKMIFSAEDNDGKIEIKFRIKPLTLIIIIAAFVVVVSIIILIIIALARKKSGTDNEYKKIKID